MSRTLTWVHLSDIHVGSPYPSWDADIVRERLIEDLNSSHWDSCQVDFLFITGDLVYGNHEQAQPPIISEQYGKAREFIEKVCKAVDVPPERVFIVPGNHDIVTSCSTEKLESVSSSCCGDPQKISNLLAQPDEDMKAIFKRFAEYGAFLKDARYGCCETYDYERYVGWTHVDVRGMQVGIASLNTSCLSKGRDEQGHLWLGDWQIEKAHEAIKEADIRVLLTHHPTDWLSNPEASKIGDLVLKRFDVHLHGHEHWNTVRKINDKLLVGGGACYLRPCGDPRNRTGYNVTTVNLAAGSSRSCLRTYGTQSNAWIPLTDNTSVGSEGVASCKSLKFGSATRPCAKASTEQTSIPAPSGSPSGSAKVQQMSAPELLRRKLDCQDTDWVAVSDFDPDGLVVSTRYEEIPSELPEPCQEIYDYHKRMESEAEERGEDYKYSNGSRYRLLRLSPHNRTLEEERNKVTITFGPSDYFRFLATSRVLDKEFEWPDGRTISLRDKYLSDVAGEPERVVDFLANSFGLNILIVTADNKAIFVQRSENVALRKSMHHISVNEGLRASDGKKLFDQRSATDKTPLIDEKAAPRGVLEEMGYALDPESERVIWTRLGLDTDGYQYGLLGYVRVKATTQEILSLAQYAKDLKLETLGAFYAVDFTPEAICEFIISRNPWVAWAIDCLYEALASVECLKSGDPRNVDAVFRHYAQAI